MSIREDELAGLSEEERLALAEEDTAVDVAAPEDGVTGETAEAAPVEDSVGDAIEDPASGAQTDAPAEDDYEEPFVAHYQADPVDGYEAKLAGLDTQFENGEVTLKEYNSQREALLKQQLKAEISAEQKKQADDQKWQWEIERFMEDNATYRQDPILYAALDAAIKALANQAEHASKAGRWFLAEAHRQVQSRFAAPATAPSAPAKTVTKPGSRAADVPRTLSTLPAAADNGAGNDEFSSIENLLNTGKVMEAERLLARLTPEQQARYLEAAG